MNRHQLIALFSEIVNDESTPGRSEPLSFDQLLAIKLRVASELTTRMRPLLNVDNRIR